MMDERDAFHLKRPVYHGTMGQDTNQYFHGTTTVSLKFADGVVLAADKRASAGYLVASKVAEKIHKLNGNTMATIAGMVADAQYLVKLTRANIKLFELEREYPPTTKMIGNLLATILYNQYRAYFPYFVQMIVAGVDDQGPHIYVMDAAGGVTEEKFASTGSGSPIAYGYLEAAYKDELEKNEAISIALKALSSAISRDIATGDGIDCYVVTKKGIEKIEKDQIQEILEGP